MAREFSRVNKNGIPVDERRPVTPNMSFETALIVRTDNLIDSVQKLTLEVEQLVRRLESNE